MSSRKRDRSGVPLQVCVVAVGDELLNGFVVNTNAAWLGQRMSQIGVQVNAGRIVADDEIAIAASVREALTTSDAVIVTGGLGPTSDDRTRHALALLAEVELVRDVRAESVLRERLEAQGRTASVQHLTQVDLPAGAAAIPNSAGTAPGIRMSIGDHVIYAVPGPPHEMRAVVDAGVVNDLVRRRRSFVLTYSLRTALIPESEVAAMIAPLEVRHTGVRVAYLASPAEVVVRMTATGDDDARVTALVDAASEDAREVLGDAVVGEASQTLAQAVVGLMAAAGRTVAVAESLTGGAIAAAITDVPGSSAMLKGGIVAYATEAKEDVLGVDVDLVALHGPVHPAVARAMAEAVRARFMCDYGIGTTGVAGPTEQNGKPVGTVHVAVAGPHHVVDVSLHLHGDRDTIRRQTVVQALDLLRRTVLGLPPRKGPSSD